MTDENPYQPPRAETGFVPEPEGRARRRGIRRSLGLALLLWLLLVALGLRDAARDSGPYAGIGLLVTVYFGGPAVALLQWAYLLPWVLTRPDGQRAYQNGLLLGGLIAMGICILLPGVLCLGMGRSL